MNKVLFIISDFEGGGTQRVISLLANYLSRNNYEIKICIINQSKIKYFLSKRVKKIELKIKSNKKNFFDFIFKNLQRLALLRKIFKSHKDYILVSFLNTTNILCLLSSIGINSKIIINERNDILKQKLNFTWTFLKFITYNLADLITTNNKSNLLLLKSKYGKKVNYINNPVEIKKFKKQKRKKIILSVGRLNDQKNYPQLLRCFKAFSLKNDNWTYNILGEGELRKKIIEYIKFLGLERKVKIFNFTDPSSFYKKSSILIHGAKYEGTPNVLLEAMSFRVPIISSNYNGCSEIIKHNYNGIIYKIESDEDLLKNMQLLAFSNDLSKQLSDNGYSYVKKYDISEISKEWIKLLNKLK